jgi:hypothetical protein
MGQWQIYRVCRVGHDIPYSQHRHDASMHRLHGNLWIMIYHHLQFLWDMLYSLRSEITVQPCPRGLMEHELIQPCPRGCALQRLARDVEISAASATSPLPPAPAPRSRSTRWGCPCRRTPPTLWGTTRRSTPRRRRAPCPSHFYGWRQCGAACATEPLSASSLPRAVDVRLHAASRRSNDGGGVRRRCVKRYDARMRAASERRCCTSTGFASLCGRPERPPAVSFPRCRATHRWKWLCRSNLIRGCRCRQRREIRLRMLSGDADCSPQQEVWPACIAVGQASLQGMSNVMWAGPFLWGRLLPFFTKTTKLLKTAGLNLFARYARVFFWHQHTNSIKLAQLNRCPSE